ncbi:MAG: hypothetical protein WC544_01570 [Patescibacteria group bacterium]
MKRGDVRGSLLIEVMVSVSLLVIFSFAIGSFATANDRLVTRAKMESTATDLARESMEQLYAIKDQDWLAIGNAQPGHYIISEVDNDFVLAPDPSSPAGELVEATFTRIITLEPAYRDGAGNIAGSGTEDQHTRHILVTVSWVERGAASSVELSGYVTDWKGQ